MKKSNEHFGYFHVYNRGVDKRIIFIDDRDRVKFLGCIKDLVSKDWNDYVKILAYCLMDNHYHLLIEQLSEDGLPKYMQRVGTAYTMYFNKKYERSGALFESRYKSKHITSDTYLFHIFRYIHLNPLKFINPKWKSGTKKICSAINFIINYKWSNVRKIFSTINNAEHILKYEFNSLDNYSKFLLDWIRYGLPHQLNPIK